MRQPHLVEQSADLESLHHAEALQQRQVCGEHLGEAPRQWLVRRVTGDIERQHGDRLRIAWTLRQLIFPLQRYPCLLVRSRAPREQVARSHGGRAVVLGECREVVGVHRDGLIVVPLALERLSQDQRAQRVLRPNGRAASRNGARAVVLLRGEQRRRVAQQRFAVAGVLSQLLFELRDFFR
jgi:hypothetical protein